LFSFYFFVLQSVFVWLLRWEPKFYWLALVNCVFICLIAFFAKDTNSSVDEKSQWRYENVMKKESEFKMWHIWIFLISFLFGILVIFWLKDIVLFLRVWAWIIWAIIVFLFGWLIFNYKAFRVWEWKFYLILLILVLIWSIIKLLNVDFSMFNFKSSEEINNLTWEIVEENIVIPEEEIIIENNTGDILTWVDEEISNDLWEFVELFWEDVDLDSIATFADVIKYLLKDEKLSTKTDLTFSFIWKSNPDYAYYKTAYEKKMIWKDLQPTKNLMCETYVVMKGLVEEWNVWTYSDIKQAYWAYAKNNWLLPSCDYWEYVKFRDLIN
jgi:hypothetical protein